ncbi:hypothetical protein RRG08_057083 [Elysia crispata]|uniref:Uncharacterized protein n=1 Tax=Elysia crispata TaxID=231223 RepID=A0AAE1ALQ5_9GAST|nr:hypothetical protein RRG08_057083 [Elysia crispata]
MRPDHLNSTDMRESHGSCQAGPRAEFSTSKLKYKIKHTLESRDNSPNEWTLLCQAMKLVMKQNYGPHSRNTAPTC